jgi:hypothetical protein
MIAVAEKIRNDNYIYFNLFMYFHKQTRLLLSKFKCNKFSRVIKTQSIASEKHANAAGAKLQKINSHNSKKKKK